MKKYLLFLLTLAILGSCDSNPESYTITGTVRGEVADGTNVYLKKIGVNNQPVAVDTTKIEMGKFVFTGKADLPEMHYIFIDQLMGYTAVILENGEIEYSAQKDSLGMAKIQGTDQNEIFANYLGKSKKISSSAINIQNDIKNATMRNDTISVISLREELSELQDEYNVFEMDYIKTHPTALISVLLIDRALSSRNPAIEELQELYNALSPEIKETSAAKKVEKILDSKRANEEKAKSTSVGSVAPNFSAPTPDGPILALNDVLGKVTLVDFWAAWCRPCRAENPNVVNVYKKYHDKGLNIIGVSLDKTAEAWKKAIEEDGLTWHHVSNIAYFDDAIAKLYNVNAIPAAFLLDENGVIVAKDLRGAALEAKVAELLQ